MFVSKKSIKFKMKNLLIAFFLEFNVKKLNLKIDINDIDNAIRFPFIYIFFFVELSVGRSVDRSCHAYNSQYCTHTNVDKKSEINENKVTLSRSQQMSKYSTAHVLCYSACIPHGRVNGQEIEFEKKRANNRHTNDFISKSESVRDRCVCQR